MAEVATIALIVSITAGIIVASSFIVQFVTHVRENRLRYSQIATKFSDELSDVVRQTSQIKSDMDFVAWMSSYLDRVETFTHLLILKKLDKDMGIFFNAHLHNALSGIVWADKEFSTNPKLKTLAPNLVLWCEANPLSKHAVNPSLVESIYRVMKEGINIK